MKVYGFDVQQVPFVPSESQHDEAALESFVSTNVLSLNPRISELRLCGPNSSTAYATGPKDDEELAKCHNFLKDLRSFINDEIPNAHDLIASIIALRYSAGSSRFNSEEDSAIGNAWRDEGMAEMIRHLKTASKRTIILAHNGHVFHAGQEAIPFATKTMGSFLDDFYGKSYVVFGCFSFKVTKASWWRDGNQGGEDVYFRNLGSLEEKLYSLNLGNLLVEVKSNSILPLGAKVELNGIPDIPVQKHMDGIFFVPETMPMTNFPGVIYP